VTDTHDTPEAAPKRGSCRHEWTWAENGLNQIVHFCSVCGTRKPTTRDTPEAAHLPSICCREHATQAADVGRDTPEAALTAALRAQINYVEPGGEEAVLAACREQAADILAALPSGWCGHGSLVDEVAAEGKRAKALHGEPVDRSGLHWLAILAEEFGEVAQEVTKGEVPPINRSRAMYLGNLRGELVQVASVAMRWLAAVDRAGTALAPSEPKQDWVLVPEDWDPHAVDDQHPCFICGRHNSHDHSTAEWKAALAAARPKEDQS
jgi:NTP pyrophosphatase (non-canonical NTP hydrolase)